MKIKKRSGEFQEYDPTKILERIRRASKGLKVNFANVCLNLQKLLYDGISTIELDSEAARIAASYVTLHPDYSTLASRILISRLHKELNTSYLDRVGEKIDQTIIDKIKEWDIKPNRDKDYLFDYFGISTFLQVYSLNHNDKKLETPGEMYLRVISYLEDNKDDLCI